MRILVLHAIPPGDARLSRVADLVAALLRAGHPTRVVASPPGRVGGFLAALRLRRVVRGFGAELVYERHEPSHFAGIRHAKRSGVPHLLHVDAIGAVPRWRESDRVLAGSVAVAAALRDQGVPGDRITLLPDGAALDHFLPAPFAPCTGPLLRLGLFGAPAAQVAAMLRPLAATVSVTPVNPPADRLADLLAGIDVALHPAAAAVVDLMAAGCAIVAADTPDMQAFLAHDRTALLVDPASPETQRLAILRLCDEPGLRHRLGAAARAELERRGLTAQDNARRIVALEQCRLRLTQPSNKIAR